MLVMRVPQDGNCLFHSLATFFESPKIDHVVLRKLIVAYIFKNATHFQADILAEGFPSVQQYCRFMSQNQQWGDGVCLQAFALIFQVNIWICYSEIDPDASTQISHYAERPHLCLLLQGNHYDRVLRKGPTDGAPL
jgi:hypothetical protein